MQTKVKRRPFGNTGLSVSEVGFGAMNLRMLQTEEEAIAMVNFVLDQGINLIDTARGYKGINGSGVEVQSEDLVGRAIAARTDLDEPIVIISKCHGYTPETFEEDLEATYRTMGIRKTEKGLFIGQNEIKLVYFYHGIMQQRWDSMKATGSIENGLRHQKAGDITYLGFSAHYGDGKVIREAIDTGYFQVVELPYNIYNRSIGEDGPDDLLRYAHEKGLATVNMKAFNGTSMLLAHKLIKDIVDIPYSEMLHFNLANQNISTIDVGARYPEEFLADVETSLLPGMTPDEREEAKKDADKVASLLNSGICRECMHCMEKFSCPQGIDFPAILGNYARFSIAKSVGKDTTPYTEKYAAMPDPKADACVACGACKEWCEYHLDIPAMLVRVNNEM